MVAVIITVERGARLFFVGGLLPCMSTKTIAASARAAMRSKAQRGPAPGFTMLLEGGKSKGESQLILLNFAVSLLRIRLRPVTE